MHGYTSLTEPFWHLSVFHVYPNEGRILNLGGQLLHGHSDHDRCIVARTQFEQGEFLILSFIEQLDQSFPFLCPVEAALEVIGGKWKGIVLYHLLSDTMRFNELRRLIPEVTQKMLTRQLRELEAEELIVRTIYPEVPPRVEYSITDYGRTLMPVLDALQAWGIHHLERQQNEQRC